MYLVRDVFMAQPGKAKELVELFRSASPKLQSKGAKNIRILTDVVADFWTVVWEFEVERIDDYFQISTAVESDLEVFQELEGYKNYVSSGHREVFRIH